MPNPRRGEIEAVLDGRPRTLVLTLGALAELEAAFAVTDLAALADRFAAGRLAAADLIRLIGAGLRGAGDAVTDAEVAAMRIDDGALGAAAVAGRLLAATFGGAEPAGEGTAGPFAAGPSPTGRPATTPDHAPSPSPGPSSWPTASAP